MKKLISLFFVFALFYVKPASAYTVIFTCVPTSGNQETIQFELHYMGNVHILSKGYGYCGGAVDLVSSQGKLLEMAGNLGGPQCRKGLEIRWKDEYGIQQTVRQRIIMLTSVQGKSTYNCVAGLRK